MNSNNLFFLTGLLYKRLDDWCDKNNGKKPFVIIKIVEWSDDFTPCVWNKTENNGENVVNVDKKYDDFKLITNKVKFKKITRKTNVIYKKKEKGEIIKEETVEFIPQCKTDVMGHIELIDDVKSITEYTIKHEPDYYKVNCYNHLIVPFKEESQEVTSYYGSLTMTDSNGFSIEKKHENVASPSKSDIMESLSRVIPNYKDAYPASEILIDNIFDLDNGCNGNVDLSVMTINPKSWLWGGSGSIAVVRKKAKSIQKELNGIANSLTIDSKLKPMCYQDDFLIYEFQKLVCETTFYDNLKADVRMLRQKGLCHSDVHSGNVSYSGHLIDNGMIKPIGSKLELVHNFVRNHLNSNRCDLELDDRCVETLKKMDIYQAKRKEYFNIFNKYCNNLNWIDCIYFNLFWVYLILILLSNGVVTLIYFLIGNSNWYALNVAFILGYGGVIPIFGSKISQRASYCVINLFRKRKLYLSKGWVTSHTILNDFIKT